MQLKQTGNTYTLTDITQAELEMLFHPHNVMEFSRALPQPLRVTSDHIYETLADLAYNRVMGNATHKLIVEAMTHVEDGQRW